MHLDEAISSAGKDVLVEIVKLAQKRGMKGSKGNWKEFLSVYDKKFGSSLSDPSRRPIETLADFLKTFEQQDDLKFLEKVLHAHSNDHKVEQLNEKTSEADSFEQKLVRSTLEHPLFLSSYLFPSYEEGWMVTKPIKNKKHMKSTGMIAIDCEMVLCEDGTEALVRVCAVGRNLEVKLNELVKPEKAVSDYRSEITGITAKDLDGVTCSLIDVQKILMKLLSHGTILIGHSLNNDMMALKIDHPRVIDTSLIFKYGEETTSRRPSLNALCKAVLGYEVRKKGAPHNCLDDACAAMKLVLTKLKSGSDEAIPIDPESVPEIDFSKLLIHGIPINVPSEELHDIIPGNFTIEVKPNKKGRGDKYAAFIIFKNDKKANKAFEKINAEPEKDTAGLPQKCVVFKLKSGLCGSFYIRKMGHNSLLQNSSKKRSAQAEEETEENVAKKPKGDEKVKAQTEPNNCDDHLKEIERLKRELSQRDKEISVLNKLIASLTRKQGL